MAQPTTIQAPDVQPGELRSVDVGGTRVGIANVDGQLYAFHDECTHEQCPLVEEGTLDGHVLTCGCHGAQFDVRTGKVLAPPAPEPIAVYPVRLQGGALTIEV
jgi:3-phenylpropionate/trans-cinnamate dioxygenase ferredoxin subunit